jgi:putative transposase
VIAASTQDRDCAAKLFEAALKKYPRLKKFFADGGYQGPKLAAEITHLPASLEIVKRTDKGGGFKVVRRRWVIERTFSWLRRNRRLTAHYEALAIMAVGFIKLAMINIMLKRLTERAA